jgi:Kef-type K+ transport system membrane component KefB
VSHLLFQVIITLTSHPVIMASVVTSLNPSSPNSSLGWSIGRPILAAALMTILVPVATHYVLEPFVRLVLRARIQRWAPYGEACILVLFLAGLCTIASYAGTSVLYGAYLSGTVLAYMDGKQSGASSHALSNAEPHSSFTAVYDRFLQPVQHALLEPLFFASIGFAIPFKLAWRPPLLWRGIVYALLMAVGKLAVGIWIPLVTHLPHVARAIRVRLGVGAPVKPADTATRASVLVPSALLGLAMVARGEIGLLILQLGYTRSGRLREDSFVVGTWAVVLNTLVGPLAVGVLVRRAGERVRNGPWGDSRVAKERADEVGPGQAA